MWALLVIALVVLLLLGADRISLLGKGLGEGVKAFKKTVREPERPSEPPSPRRVIVVSAEPKQLPAKNDDDVDGSPSDPSDPQQGPR